MFNARLKSARKTKGYTMQRLADVVGISMRGYQYYESGHREPNFGTLVLLANTLDVSIDWLLGRDDWLRSHGVSVDELL